MGEVQLDDVNRLALVYADLYFYGNAASGLLLEAIAADIAGHWNEPGAAVEINDVWYAVRFIITGSHASGLTATEVYRNVNPRNNYFRIETFVRGNVSFVDGVPCNTGYFKLDNLLNNSTTAAHEFGHTIGLRHPGILDIRGKGIPAIMYPRGTIVDPPFQYDPTAAPGQPGGTMNPFTRKVLLDDIAALRLHALPFDDTGKAVLGDFTSVWHEAHQP